MCYLLAQARWLGVDVMYVPEESPYSGNSLSLATTEYCSLFFYSACQNAMTTGWFYENRAWLSRDSVSESQTWMAAIGTRRSQKPQIVFSLDEQLKAT